MLCHSVPISHLVLVSQPLIIKNKFFWVLHNYMQLNYMLCHTCIMRCNIHVLICLLNKYQIIINPKRARAQLSTQLHIDYKKFNWHHRILYYIMHFYMSLMDMLVSKFQSLVMMLTWLDISISIKHQNQLLNRFSGLKSVVLWKIMSAHMTLGVGQRYLVISPIDYCIPYQFPNDLGNLFLQILLQIVTF